MSTASAFESSLYQMRKYRKYIFNDLVAKRFQAEDFDALAQGGVHSAMGLYQVLFDKGIVDCKVGPLQPILNDPLQRSIRLHQRQNIWDGEIPLDDVRPAPAESRPGERIFCLTGVSI